MECNEERFHLEALRMIVDTPWYMTNTVIRRDLKTQELKMKSTATSLNTVLASVHAKGHSRQQQEITETPAKLSAYQIPSIIVVFVVLVFKV
jgi:hypothetical protein